MLKADEITAAVSKDLRERSGLGQRAFWAAVGVAQSVGCRYEAGTNKIPRPVRMLLASTYGNAELPKPTAKVSPAIVRDLERAERTIGQARAALAPLVTTETKAQP